MLLVTPIALLSACSEDSGETLKGQTNVTVGKNVKKVPTPKLVNANVNHEVAFNGQKIKLIATYGIDKQYAHNWKFTSTEKVNLSIKPVENYKDVRIGVNNVYADVSISSSKTRYNGARQDSVNISYSQMPNGMVSISKSDGYMLPFQVESINENETSFYMINGYGESETSRISESELRDNAYGAKLNVVWTISFTDQSNHTYLKTINDSIGIPYKQNNQKLG